MMVWDQYPGIGRETGTTVQERIRPMNELPGKEYQTKGTYQSQGLI